MGSSVQLALTGGSLGARWHLPALHLPPSPHWSSETHGLHLPSMHESEVAHSSVVLPLIAHDAPSPVIQMPTQAPVCGFLIVAGTQQEQARQEQKRDPGPTCGRPDQRADCPPNKHAGDGHAGLEEREDQGDPQPISSLESGDAERGAQGEGVEGEGE